MPRSKFGNKREKVVAGDMEAAVKAVIKKECSFTHALQVFNVKRTTLRRQLQIWQKNKNEDEQLDVKRIFTMDEEKRLAVYASTICQINYGLSVKRFREVVYQFALVLGRNVPAKWAETKMAGEEWERIFRKRHKELSLRKPEPKRLSRATAFNQTKVSAFFEMLRRAMEKYGPFEPHRIYNVDETGLTTVQVPENVITPKG